MYAPNHANHPEFFGTVTCLVSHDLMIAIFRVVELSTLVLDSDSQPRVICLTVSFKSLTPTGSNVFLLK
jgi:hypothetical protein